MTCDHLEMKDLKINLIILWEEKTLQMMNKVY